MRVAAAGLFGLAVAAGCAPAGAAPLALSGGPEQAPWAVRGQLTWIRQLKPSFAAAYTGPQSLRPEREWSSSRSVTVDLGLRLWPGAQLHLNPEGAAGLPLSGLTGAAGISNGELQRGASPTLTGYLARGYVQQRISLHGPSERVPADFNELGETVGERRWTLLLGTFSVLDLMDPNPYAKDPREQFTNWAFLTHGAWDYPADARGYTTGAMAEYRAPTLALRVGRALQPRQSNGLALDWNFRRQWGDFAELESELPWTLPGGPVRARLLLFSHRINGGAFADALAAASGRPGPPALAEVRRLQTKRGWGLTLQLPVGEEAGIFLRASRSDGRTEAYAFTEIDQQLAVGAQLGAAAIGRPQDRWGIGVAINGLSGPHREYLRQGGLGAFLGDGRLAYRPERVHEGWYRFTLSQASAGGVGVQSSIGGGLQWLRNPGYNGERTGNVLVWTLRLHAEF